MTTTTTASFFKTLDKMVVDYINRKDEISRTKLLAEVHEESEFYSKSNVETPTLESLLLYYACHHDVNFRSSTPDDNGLPPQEPVSNGVYLPLDMLPEASNIVLSCTPLKTLYTMRLLSRNWYHVTSEYLRNSKKQRTVEFKWAKKVSGFILAFSNSMETPLPFSSFSIDTSAVDSLSVLERIGTHLRTGTLAFGPAITANSLILVHCFKFTPFLTRLKLCFGEYGLQKGNSSQCTLTLPYLRSIEVYQRATLQWSALEPLLRYCPSLESLRVAHCKLITDSDLEFASFVDYVSSLRSARFEEVLSPVVDHVTFLSPTAGSKIQSLKLHVGRESAAATSYMIGRMSQALEHLVLLLSVVLRGQLTMPTSLPKLKRFSVFLNRDNGFTTGLLPVVIPAITTLTILCHYPYVNQFQGVYSTVTTLNLHEAHRREILLHASFPNVTTLRISGTIVQSHIRSIGEIFPRLAFLHMGFGPYQPAYTSKIFKLKEVHGKMQWYLSQLTDLKHLIVQVPDNMVDRLLTEILDLCLNQNMPVLDTLKVILVEPIVYCQNPQPSKAAEVEPTVRELLALQYHKHFHFETQKKYLYEHWLI